MIGIQSGLQPMVVRACIGIIAATGLYFTGVVSSTACVDNSKANNAESEWNALVQIGQKISEESLSPPVHQQLCLSAIRGMYQSRNIPIPRSLVNELSACSSLDGMKSVFMVLSALKRHSPAKLMGSHLTSDGICRRSVELPDQLGAIEALPYAVCVPWPTVSPATANDHSRVEPNSGRMQMEPDIEKRNTDKDLLEQAVKHLVHQ